MQNIYQELYRWYRVHGRHDLPWRNSDDPYHIYLSEVMLQQTQVKTVLERYYFPFLKRFPTLEALAEAPLDEVLKRWEGLGYYTRAKNLHKAAQHTAPSLPSSYDALLALPGIGKNTAAAICAFAFKQKRAVMEANVRRLLCRIYALDDPKEEVLIQKAHHLLDEDNPFDYNQAMMDMGSMVCTPRAPACDSCAFRTICKAYALGCYDFPVKRKRVVPTRREIVVVSHAAGSVVLEQRAGRFLHGLWGFPAAETASGERLGEVRHQYTHFKLEVEVWHLESESVGEGAFDRKAIDRLALSTVDKKILKLLDRAGITIRR